MPLLMPILNYYGYDGYFLILDSLIQPPLFFTMIIGVPFKFLIMIFFISISKHIEIDCYYIHHHLTQDTLNLVSVSSSDQTIDIFTKVHPPGRFTDLVTKLKLASILST